MESIKRFTFRIPEELFNAIEEVAKVNHRSVNAQIIVAIEDYLKHFYASQDGNHNQSIDR